MVGNRSNLCFNRIFIIVLLIPAFAKTTTTYDVQFNDSLQGSGDDCYPSPLEDSSVTLSGVVTAVKSGTYKNFFLQDRTEGQWNGVYFYDYDNSVQPSRGDSITVTADSVEVLLSLNGAAKMNGMQRFKWGYICSILKP